MKVFILVALFAATQAQLIHHGLIGTGASTQFRNQDGLGNYNFGYNEGHATGGTFRRESGNGHGVVAGSYGLSDADGRQRVVNYVADAAGFRADIKTNEPGVEPKDPAAVAINKAAIVAAPAHHAVAYAAPIGGAYAYNTAIGHHGLGHYAGLGHLGYGLGHYAGLGHLGYGLGHHGLVY